MWYYLAIISAKNTCFLIYSLGSYVVVFEIAKSKLIHKYIGFYLFFRKQAWVACLFVGFRVWALMPCPFTGQKMFYTSPNFLSQPKNLTAFSASSKPFVPAQKPILLNANHFCLSWNVYGCHNMYLNTFFDLAQKIWTSTKHFRTCKRTRH